MNSVAIYLNDQAQNLYRYFDRNSKWHTALILRLNSTDVLISFPNNRLASATKQLPRHKSTLALIGVSRPAAGAGYSTVIGELGRRQQEAVVYRT